jgi:hypothetical protein
VATGNARLEEMVESAAAAANGGGGGGGGASVGGSGGGADAAELLEAYARGGEWDKVHELAAQEGSETVARYTLKHAKLKAQQVTP